MSRFVPPSQKPLVEPFNLEGPRKATPADRVRSQRTVADTLIECLRGIGLRHAFGVIGGAVVPFYDALSRGSVNLINFRHESGAVFAALEASLADDTPALAFTTTGPGLTNALTGALTARWEGAKLLLISGFSGTGRRGRFTLQESNSHTMAAGLYRPHGLFDYAAAIEDPAEIPTVLRTLIKGFASPAGFVAHLALPLDVQASPGPELAMTLPAMESAPSSATIAEVAERLEDPFAIWVGYGARRAAPLIRELVARTNAPVLATPRAKGIFPEDDPHYLGVSGMFGGTENLVERLREAKVERTLVLGTRLGEVSTGYDEGLVPPGGLIHVDINPAVPGNAYPRAETVAVVSEIEAFLKALLAKLDTEARPLEVSPLPPPPRLEADLEHERVRPQYLMQCLQERVVEGSKSVVLSESGNSFAWTTRHLQFCEPKRYRQSGVFCPMGHVSAGLIGTAAATGLRAVAVVGDGAFLMQNEISTAARTGANVTWIVLNDARYGMVDQGLSALGYPPADMFFPEVDFLAMARALGAEGARVYRESQLLHAFEWAMSGRGPFVLDVLIDPKQPAPFGERLRSITDQTEKDS